MPDNPLTPLDDHTLGIYLREVKRQCSFAIHGFSSMQESLRNGERVSITNKASVWHLEFWYSVQAFLIAVANVSKLLWPSERKGREETGGEVERRKNRGKQLRDALGVRDDSPIKQRAHRNSFEHFDERLDSWVDSSISRNFMDDSILSLNAVKGLEATDIMRTYDPESNTLTFRGETFELSPIIQELQRLVSNAKENERREWELRP